MWIRVDCGLTSGALMRDGRNVTRLVCMTAKKNSASLVAMLYGVTRNIQTSATDITVIAPNAHVHRMTGNYV